MNEIINVSSSQFSNHVLTHLYNLQESHIPYSAKQITNHKNNVFLQQFKLSNGKNNYTPRSILFELNGGYGSYWPFEFTEKKLNPLDLVKSSNNKIEIVETNNIIEKNIYQKNLDDGKLSDGKLVLNEQNTDYWSDYNKLIYKPKSLFELNNWNHQDVKNNETKEIGIHKNFQNLKFDTFNIGFDEFNQNLNFQDDIIDTFRIFLENCDLIQGINFFQQISNAWSGFSTNLLINLKDEFFNNGINNKYNIWTYGFIDLPPSNKKKLTEIKSIIELSKNSTLFFPLSLNNHSNSLITSNFNSNNYWHTSSIYSIFINSIWGLNNQLKNSVSMSQLENDLLRGYDGRNVVNEIKLNKFIDENNQSTPETLIQNVNIMDYYNQTTEPTQNGQSNSIDLSIPQSNNNGRKTKHFSKSIICPTSSPNYTESLINEFPKTKIYHNDFINEITQIDTFPNILNNDPICVEFNQSNSFKYELQEYKKIINRVKPGSTGGLFNDYSDKSELIEDISLLIEEYTIGYDDESDDDNDDDI